MSMMIYPSAFVSEEIIPDFPNTGSAIYSYIVEVPVLSEVEAPVLSEVEARVTGCMVVLPGEDAMLHDIFAGTGNDSFCPVRVFQNHSKRILNTTIAETG
jgi:hypothetical protein